MHPSALLHGSLFFETYVAKCSSALVVDLGAQDVNGSLREVCPPVCQYLGVDVVEGKGVDIVLQDPYKLPFEDSTVDFVVSSSCFEHSEMFWVLFLEILRILKPSGICYLNVPSNGSFHRYPVDCWRFYPDSGNALVTWAKFNHYPSVLLEAFTGRQIRTGNSLINEWNDYVAIFLKDEALITHFSERILHQYRDFDNGYLHGSAKILNSQSMTEDKRDIYALLQKLNANKD